ncbi:hypothetical protein Dimus_026633 [Dionaea muscipula]
MRKTERRRAVEAGRGSAANSSRVAASAGLQERGQPHTAASTATARENGVWWIGSGENRRRDDVVDAPEEEAEEKEENQTKFDWEAVIDEVAEQGESGSNDQFFDAQVDVEEPVKETPAAPAVPVPSTVQQKETTPSGVDPSCPSGHIPEAVMNKMQAVFERARANRFQDDLEKAQAENARLLALLQQAQTKFKP